MHIYPTLTIIWLALLLSTAIVMVCRGTVTQHETDQLWLNDEDGMSLNNREHHRLLKVVSIIKPMYQVLLFATVAVSGVIAGIYIVQVWPYVHFLPQH